MGQQLNEGLVCVAPAVAALENELPCTQAGRQAGIPVGRHGWHSGTGTEAAGGAELGGWCWGAASGARWRKGSTVRVPLLRLALLLHAAARGVAADHLTGHHHNLHEGGQEARWKAGARPGSMHGVRLAAHVAQQPPQRKL